MLRNGLLMLVCIAGLAACGSQKTLDDSEPSESFEVNVARASFPARQHVAATSNLVLAVTNSGDKEIPNLAVTIWTGDGSAAAPKAQGSFSLADGPVWVPVAGYPKLVDDGVALKDLHAGPSAGADSAATDTFTLGALGPGRTRTIVWRATPVRTGSYTVNYAIAAGVQGKAKAVASTGGAVTGRLPVRIDSSPRGGCVVKAGKPGACA